MSDVGRHPLTAVEAPHARRLGRYLSGLRRAAGLTQASLALAAGLSRVQVARIEGGRRRTRRSTLRRVAAVLVVDCPALGTVDDLLDDLVAMAGPALGEESAHAERVGRRLALREDKAHREEYRRQELSVFGLLYELEWGRLRRWRPDGELEELRGEMWGYFDRRMDDEQERRRLIARLRRGS